MIWETPLQFADTVAVYYESGDYIVHNYQLHSWIVVSPADYRLVSRLQYQKMPPNALIERVAAEEGISERDARQRVGRLLMLLWANQIARHPNHKGLPPSRAVSRTVPKIVYFVTTYRCNLACSYCYAESSPFVETRGDLTTAEAMYMIDQVAELGVKAMAFTGGEALLRKDCLELVEHARARGLRVSLITNGGPVTKEKAERLAQSLSSVTVSMDSPTAEGGHDHARGAGSWLKASQAIEYFQAAGLPVAINTTVTAASVQQLPAMVEWAVDKGIQGHRIGFVSDLGRGSEAALGASLPERVWAEKASFDVMLDRLDEISLDGLKFLQNPPPPFTLKLHCGVGVEEISIDGRGDVYPCKLLHEPHLKAGNIREQSLREIWERSEIFDAMLGVNPDNLPDCQPCTFRHVCGGGCRAHQMAMTGDLLGTFNQECPSLRRSLRRHMWLHYKQHMARLNGEAAELVGGGARHDRHAVEASS